ncbi:MAG: helix-turn-helix domain-containing protein [Undibacterium sp.]|nr:helix-turn-helix domain-containing protein [Opitutaceae bacterium]
MLTALAQGASDHAIGTILRVSRNTVWRTRPADWGKGAA